MSQRRGVQLRIGRLRLASRPRDGEARLREEIRQELARLFVENTPVAPVKPRARIYAPAGQRPGSRSPSSPARELAQTIHSLWRSQR